MVNAVVLWVLFVLLCDVGEYEGYNDALDGHSGCHVYRQYLLLYTDNKINAFWNIFDVDCKVTGAFIDEGGGGTWATPYGQQPLNVQQCQCQEGWQWPSSLHQ